MFDIITFIQTRTQLLTSRIISLYIGGIVLTYLALLGALFYIMSSRISTYEENLQELNTQRDKVRIILEKQAKVDVQKNSIAHMIEQERNYKLQKYVDDTLQKTGLVNFKTSSKLTSEEDKPYIQDKLEFILSTIGMNQLCTLLHALYEDPRIYIKQLDMVRKSDGGAFDATIVVATMQAIAEGGE